MKTPTRIGSVGLAALLALSLTSLASAQSGMPLHPGMNFEKINAGVMAPMSFKAGGLVARSAQEMRTKKLDQLLPASALAGIDWSNDMLIGVVMGPQSSGGHGIRIDSLHFRITPVVVGGGAAGGSRHLEVFVVKSYPTPGMPVTKQITNPFYVIKIAKTSAPVVFSDLAPPVARTFNSLRLTTTAAGATYPTTVRVGSNGQATVSQNHPTIFFPPTPALQLEASDMSALGALVRNARAGSIPSSLFSPVGFTTATPFKLAIDAPVSTLHNASIQGMEGSYGQYRNRIEPLIGVLKRIQERVLRKANGFVEITGKVQVRGWRGWRSVWLVNGTESLKVTPWSFARTLIPFNGYEVKVEGSRGANNEVKALELLSPIRRQVSGIAQSTPQGPILYRGHLEIFPPLPNIKLTGRLARLMSRAQGRRVTADAWLFGGKAKPVALLISLSGNAKSGADLTRYGSKVNAVHAGDFVKIIGVSRSGRSVKVQPDSGRAGYMRTRNASIGELNAPLHGPISPPVAQPTVGASGHLSGTTGN
jgi:hypothetical protein